MIAGWDGPLMTLAAGHMASRPTAGGIETLVIGIVVLAVGAPFATNFRGALDRWAWTLGKAPKFLQKIPPWRWKPPGDDRAISRVVASIFAVAGLLFIPLGIYHIATGRL